MESQDCNGHPCTELATQTILIAIFLNPKYLSVSLNRKIIINHFQNYIFDAKIGLLKKIQK